jgi:formylglycine-generating enzyme required for sulfatase activity
MVEQELIRVEQDKYIFRVVHRIMEGDCQMDHGPRLVEVGPLLAQKYTVTNQMYFDFLQESLYKPKNSKNFLKHWENGKFLPGEEDLPVVNVTQNDAKAYAEYYGMRLPTEQEWQYLAAGPEKLKWPWGNQKEYTRCNVYGSGLEPVDSHPEGISPFGLFNMCGNVWEFTSEYLVDGDNNHHFIVLRGGSFYTAPNYWHTEGGAIQNDSHLKVHQLGDAMNRYETVGFRCVKEID